MLRFVLLTVLFSLAACAGGSPTVFKITAINPTVRAGGAAVELTTNYWGSQTVRWELPNPRSPGSLSATEGKSVLFIPPSSLESGSLEVLVVARLGSESDSVSVLVESNTRSFIRLAHRVADGGAVDVCLRSSSGVLGRPLLQSRGLGAGLSFPSTTRLIEVPAGSYSLRMVGAGATNCDSGSDIPNALNLTTGNTFTLGLIGTRAAPQTALFADDPVPARYAGSRKSALRFINALPSSQAAFGVSDGLLFRSFTEVFLFPNLFADPNRGFNEQGYLTLDPLIMTNITASRSADQLQPLATLSNLETEVGGLYTFWLIGTAGQTGGEARVSLLICRDVLTTLTTTEPLQSCQRSP